jgi:hypothetical protein
MSSMSSMKRAPLMYLIPLCALFASCTELRPVSLGRDNPPTAAVSGGGGSGGTGGAGAGHDSEHAAGSESAKTEPGEQAAGHGGDAGY